jgi:hypothetical protein
LPKIRRFTGVNHENPFSKPRTIGRPKKVHASGCSSYSHW